jgi:3-hydroxybutyryl-CoA dehydratase
MSSSGTTPDWKDLVTLGSSIDYRRTIAESDVYLFAGITGDFHPNHVDEQYMAEGRFGRRVVHGAYLVGLMSGASTSYAQSRASVPESVSLGYDRIRFVGPAFIGDTLTVRYTIDEIDEEKDRAIADVQVLNQDGNLLAVARHITKYVR